MKTVQLFKQMEFVRFQGKILKNDHLSILGHVLTRLKKTKDLDLVCCAY